jgi:hypothetical protein
MTDMTDPRSTSRLRAAVRLVRLAGFGAMGTGLVGVVFLAIVLCLWPRIAAKGEEGQAFTMLLFSSGLLLGGLHSALERWYAEVWPESQRLYRFTSILMVAFMVAMGGALLAFASLWPKLPLALRILFGASGAIVFVGRARARVKSNPHPPITVLYGLCPEGIVESRGAVRIVYPFEAIEEIGLTDVHGNVGVRVRLAPMEGEGLPFKAELPAEWSQMRRNQYVMRRVRQCARARAWTGADLLILALQSEVPLPAYVDAARSRGAPSQTFTAD